MIITSEVIKNAVVRRLLTVYPNISVYKEAITTPIYPNFFVNLLQVNAEEQRKGKFILTFNLEIRYRHIADPTTDLKLQQDLDDIGITLSNAFHLIDLGDSKIKCEDKYYEKVDGVLHFFFNLKEMVENPPIEEFVKQNKLQLTQVLKYGTTI